MRTQVIIIKYVGPSLNKIYAGIHWRKRKVHADEAHIMAKIACRGIKPFTKKVNIEFTCSHQGNKYDTSNYSYNAKLLEDGLVKSGIIAGDSGAFVGDIILHPPVNLKRGQEAFTVVEIKEVV